MPQAAEPPDIEEAPIDIPDDYHPDDASADSPQALQAPATRPLNGSISSADRARIMQDPLVRQVMDLFDGNLEYIDRRAQRPADPAGK